MFNDMDKKTKISSIKFLAACCFLYVVSICIKMVYSAEMAAIISAVGSDKSSVSLGLLFYYSAYAVGQLIFSFVINKIDLKWFITVTVSLTAISFGMMLFASELWHLYLILFLNGFFQVGVWGGIMFFVGRYIPAQMSGLASNLLAAGLPVGTALTYGAAAFFVSVASWRYTFLFFSVLSAISVAVFLISLRSASRDLAFVFGEKIRSHATAYVQTSGDSKAKTVGKHGAILMVVYFSVVCIFNSCLYYGLVGWFPSLLIENFSMPTEYSIFITLLLPLCTTPSSFAIIAMNERSKSDYTVMILFMSAVTGLGIMMCFLYGASILLTVVASVLMLFCMRGISSLVAVYFPLKYSDRIESGRFSLILNAFSSIAAGVMPYAISLVLERTGWRVYFIIMLAISFVTLLLVVAGRIKETAANRA